MRVCEEAPGSRFNPDCADGSVSDHDASWWKKAVIYQIYPRSFQDSNEDGIGDIPGICSRVDYLVKLGIDAVWLAPICPSPMDDFGYDIADFTGVDPVFGTMEDFDRLLSLLHERGIRLILDFVPNHTSDRHAWFRESRRSKNDLRRDWYVWRSPAKDGGPPNNWLSRFGGSAWEYDEGSGEYYYHAFLKSQPDLNWRNPEVRKAMHDVLRFWMRRGVDGFRLDAAAVTVEDDLLRDDPPLDGDLSEVPPPEHQQRIYSDNRPETLEFLDELRQVVAEFPGRVLLGEVDTSPENACRFYGETKPRIDLPLNYRLLDVEWTAAEVEAELDQYYNLLPAHAWPNWALGSHDKRRIAERRSEAGARLAALLLFTLRGTAIFYQGDELGILQVPIPPERVSDPFEKLVPGFQLGRDGERAPMRWDAARNAGFSRVEPWLPIGPNSERQNVEALKRNPHSILWLYIELIRLRRQEPALLMGEYEPLRRDGEVVKFKRVRNDTCIAVLANFGSDFKEVKLPPHARMLVTTYLDRNLPSGTSLQLRPYEGVVLSISEGAYV
ncbi:MAG: alpha-amylase [Xanthobacteraceae bacterium]|jgi:alpha-glucosidase|nr:alpha-amylase [Xanthobacteraceae bacterium]